MLGSSEILNIGGLAKFFVSSMPTACEGCSSPIILQYWLLNFQKWIASTEIHLSCTHRHTHIYSSKRKRKYNLSEIVHKVLDTEKSRYRPKYNWHTKINCSNLHKNDNVKWRANQPHLWLFGDGSLELLSPTLLNAEVKAPGFYQLVRPEPHE